MPQNEHIERHIKLFGRRYDAEQRERKRDARSVHKLSKLAQHTKGLKAKMLNKKNYNEKIQMKKTLNMNHENKSKQQQSDSVQGNAKPIYLLGMSTYQYIDISPIQMTDIDICIIIYNYHRS